MRCAHDQFRCTNGVFYCLRCGAVIPNPYTAKEEPREEPKADAKPAKRGKKQTD